MSNYNYNFNLFSDNDLYTNACNKFYRGLSPLSELETVAHNSFIKSGNFKMALNFMGFKVNLNFYLFFFNQKFKKLHINSF